MYINILDQQDLVESIKNLRKKYRVTQQMLADGIDKSKSCIVRYELGISHLNSDSIIRIFQYFSNYYVRETIYITIGNKQEKPIEIIIKA